MSVYIDLYIFAMVGTTQRKVFNLRHNPTHECCGVEYMWVCFKATASNENFIVACRNEKHKYFLVSKRKMAD